MRRLNDPKAARRLFRHCLPLFVLVFAFSPAIDFAQPKALVLDDSSLPGYDRSMMEHLDATLAAAGYTVAAVSSRQLADDDLASQKIGLLVLPDASRIPSMTAAPVTKYLHDGGHLIALGAPAWSDGPIHTTDGRWLSQPAYKQAMDAVPEHVKIIDFSDPAQVANLRRDTDTPDSKTTDENEPVSGLPFANALHVEIADLNSWDGFTLPAFTRSPFRQGDDLTMFWARGDSRTISLNIEWDMTDGARWIATIPLTQEWRRYELRPDQFLPWADSGLDTSHGLQVSQANRLNFGLDQSNASAGIGPHSYWIADLGTGRDIRDRGLSPTASDLPPIETLAPSYKLFDVHGAVRFAVPPGQAIVDVPDLPRVAEGDVMSPYPRPSGLGINKQRGWRWQSLVTAVDAATGAWRGSPVTLYMNEPENASAPGAVWATFSIDDPAFYESSAAQMLIGSIARRMRDGLFLTEGGASFFTYFPDQTVTLGASAVDLSGDPAEARSAEAQVTVANEAGKVVYSRTWPLSLSPGRTTRMAASWKPASWPDAGYIVTTRLRENGVVVDQIQHEIHVWRPSPSPDYVAIHPDGHFYLDGKLWRANGINYMPSSGIAYENKDFYEYWMDSQPYDPQIVDRDLAHIQALGFNAISIGGWVRGISSQNLLDVLRLARVHHLHVNLALRPGMSRMGDPDNISGMLSILKYYHLPENDTVFAYDIAWEPQFGNQERRVALDPWWRQWIASHYGSVAAAEQAWGYSAPLDASGQVTNPADRQMGADAGPYAKMVADYRRFLDDWEAGAYGPAVAALHQADPNHYVSCRMNNAGCPIYNPMYASPYQFQGLARVMDIMEPEGYTAGLADGVDAPGIFELAYARSVAPTKPVLWAETGVSVWQKSTNSDSIEAEERAGQDYQNWYAMCRKGGADGVFFWWYPGGYRYDERSDCGIVNPDGTDRPAAAIVREESASFLDAPAPPPPTTWLPYDRFAQPGDVYGIYLHLKGAFFNALDAGQNVGLRPAD